MFPARRRSANIRGDCMTKPPPTLSACHPGGNKGNVSSRVRHQEAAWLDSPHEKHTTVGFFRRSAPRGGCSSVGGLTGSKFCISTSMSEKLDLPIGAGCTGWSFPIRRCINSSNSEGIGVAFGGDTTGLGSKCCSNDSNSSWASGVIFSPSPGRSSPPPLQYLSYKRGGAVSGWGTIPLGPRNQYDSPTPGIDQRDITYRSLRRYTIQMSSERTTILSGYKPIPD